MKFWTIWTMPAMSLDERLRRTRDCAAMGVARHLPLRVRYWVTLQEIGHATMKSKNVPASTVEEILPALRSPKVVS
jgi:hypothetical protein